MTVDNTFWEDRYTAAAASSSSVWSLEPNTWIASTVERLAPKTAVDLGAGEGRNALWLASLGWKVAAVDFSPAGLAIGRARGEHRHLEVEWIVADATTWVAPRPVDLVVMAYLQLPQDLFVSALHNALASLSVGGRLAMVGHDVDNLTQGTGGPQNIALLNSVEQLRAAVASADLKIEIVECRQVKRTTADGSVAIDTILVARRR